MQPIRFGISLSQHYHDWPALVAEARLADECGFDSLWVFDHLVSMRDGVDGPTMEAWMLLAALAPLTRHLQLGTLVTSNTFRHPALLAKQAVTLDHVSGGRAMLGVGAGWYEDEHRMYGIPLPPIGERVERFGEALAIIDRLMTSERTTFAGRHYQLVDAPFAPKAVQQPRIPVLIGAKKPRMLRLVARYADIYDADAAPDDPAETDIAARLAQLDEFCREFGRDPATLRRSVWSRTALRSASETAAFIAAYRSLGFTDFFFKLPDPDQFATVRQRATTVIAAARIGQA
ncbi:MAG: TIGR03560 family F420-dependent LLM class oxidoreductase [Chloroflexi bacterium]|nr:TIGR03560 family F420-dependent LLM class oxidoreductase [Chloroflexota bacterium]